MKFTIYCLRSSEKTLSSEDHKVKLRIEDIAQFKDEPILEVLKMIEGEEISSFVKRGRKLEEYRLKVSITDAFNAICPEIKIRSWKVGDVNSVTYAERYPPNVSMLVEELSDRMYSVKFRAQKGF